MKSKLNWVPRLEKKRPLTQLHRHGTLCRKRSLWNQAQLLQASTQDILVLPSLQLWTVEHFQLIVILFNFFYFSVTFYFRATLLVLQSWKIIMCMRSSCRGRSRNNYWWWWWWWRRRRGRRLWLWRRCRCQFNWNWTSVSRYTVASLWTGRFSKLVHWV